MSKNHTCSLYRFLTWCCTYPVRTGNFGRRNFWHVFHFKEGHWISFSMGRHSSSLFTNFLGYEGMFFTTFVSMMSSASSKTLPCSEDGLLSPNKFVSTYTTSWLPGWHPVSPHTQILGNLRSSVITCFMRTVSFSQNMWWTPPRSC